MKTAIVTDIHIGFTAKKGIKFRKYVERIVEQGVETLLISGDIATNKIGQIEQAFKHIREISKDLKVLIVFGNHDYWDADRNFDNLFSLVRYRDELCKKYNIQYLQNNHYEDDEIQVFGYDGWYTVPEPGSNDNYQMPGNSLSNFYYLTDKEKDAVNYICQNHNPNKKTVVMTHFNPYVTEAKWKIMSGNPVSFYRVMDLGIDYFIYGHTHQKEQATMDGKTVIINAGADYYTAPSLQNKYQLIKDI